MLSKATKTIMKAYEEIVVSIKDPNVIETALRLAYYTALRDAAIDDPMDDLDDQQEALDICSVEIREATTMFHQLTNAYH